MPPKVLHPLIQPRQVGGRREWLRRRRVDTRMIVRPDRRNYIYILMTCNAYRRPSASYFRPWGSARTQTSLHVEKISRRTSAHSLDGTQLVQGLECRMLLVDRLLLLDHTECVDRTRGVHSCTRSTHAAVRERTCVAEPAGRAFSTHAFVCARACVQRNGTPGQDFILRGGRGGGGVPDVRNCIRCPFGASYTVAWYVCIQPPSSISTMNLPAELVGAPHLSRTAREPTHS